MFLALCAIDITYKYRLYFADTSNFCWFCGSMTIYYPFQQLPDYLTYFYSKALAQAKPSQNNTNCENRKIIWVIMIMADTDDTDGLLSKSPIGTEEGPC